MEKKNYINQDKYKFILENMPICCVDIILYNSENEILFLERNTSPVKNQLWFPGGRVLKNEKLVDGAKRKIKEEIGLSVNKLNYLLTDETIFKDSPFENINTHSINIIYYGKIDEKKEIIKIDKYSNRYIFLSKLPKNLHPYLKKSIIEFKKVIGNIK